MTRAASTLPLWGAFLSLLGVLWLWWTAASTADEELTPLQNPSVLGPWDRSTTPRREARPADHDALWLQRHGAAALAMQGQSCATCHTERECSQCHAGLSAPPTVHPPGYALLHGIDALRDTQSCASCHSVTRWCATCHVQGGIDGPRSTPALTAVHPPHWLDVGHPGNHAEEARRNLLSCAGCHSGDSCATCHAHINPHGHGFDRRCHGLLRRNEATCARCHTPQSPLPVESLRRHPACQR